jgi:hypothetical protein
MWGTPVLLLSLLAMPAADTSVRCVLDGPLTFAPALGDVPAPVTASLTGHAAECSDRRIQYAEVTAALTGQAGRGTARLSGTATYTWHLKSGATSTSTQAIAGIGIGTAFSFEGPFTTGRYTGQTAEITPILPPTAPAGPLTTLQLFARLRIRP